MSADPLSDVLHSVRLSGAVFFHVEASSPWVVEAPPARAVAGIMPRAQHVIEYHVVTRGLCFGGIAGEPAVRLAAGDIIVFPQGDAHVLSSAPGMRQPPDLALYARVLAGPRPLRVPLGPGGAQDCEILCGFLGCDARPFNPLLATLPRVLHARVEESADGALGMFVAAAAGESRVRRPGGESVLARLSELMFVEVVRRHLEAIPAGGTGWLAGLRDEFVGRALGQLHRTPAHPWTLAELARRSALSRSALAERFVHLVGEPPMQYLARWRMQVAAGLLAVGSASVAEVGAEVGYASEAAFSRAFKRAVGVAPGAWRQRGRRARPAASPPRGALHRGAPSSVPGAEVATGPAA